MDRTSHSKEMIDEMLLLPYYMSLASEYNFDLGLLDQYDAQPPSGRCWATCENRLLAGHYFQVNPMSSLIIQNLSRI